MNGRWTPHDTRDEVIDFVRELTELPVTRLVSWSGLSKGKYLTGRRSVGQALRQGQRAQRHDPSRPLLTDDEKQAILDYHDRNPLDGYRRLTFMMLDNDVAAASPSSAYRVLRAQNRLDRWNRRPSKKGTGFKQPQQPHEHWHTTRCGANRLHQHRRHLLLPLLDPRWLQPLHRPSRGDRCAIRESMKESEVELIIERARERFPGLKPRIISDNGPQFIAKDFKSYIRLVGMTHVRISPYYPQSKSSRPAADRALAQDHDGGLHPHVLASSPRRSPTGRRAFRCALQQQAPALSHRLHHPSRPPTRPPGCHLGRQGRQARGRQGATSPGPSSRKGLTHGSRMLKPCLNQPSFRYDPNHESGSR